MSFRVLFGAAFLCSLSACASVKPLPESYQPPEPLPTEYLAGFCYQPSPITEDLRLIREKRKYRIYEGSFEAGLDDFGDDSPITFEYYERLGQDVSPVVLLLPILNGTKHLMRPFATLFAKKGYGVIIVDTVQRRTLLDDLQNPEPSIRQVAQRHRRVIDWAETRPELDVSRLGVFGASLGGFNALYLSALDERVDVAAIALVGGSLSDVLVNSKERRIVEAVTAVKKELSLDDEQLAAYLDERIETDTLTIAPHVNADRILMVLAKRDKSVPYSSQLELYEAMGRPESITLPTGHATTAAYLFYLRSRILRFFDRKLAAPPAVGTAVVSPQGCDPVSSTIDAGK
ncbi:MAG: dienelactone hydrolase family protein [Gammaproteobacteria bacterium]|nr:dienelactone hydrolase family protein [Gammaproteobacteria bacterium]MDH5215907.1 dienelactone hydrolase family protein [Gammaproteobacteria bacterium]